MRDNAQREQSHAPIISGASYRHKCLPNERLGFRKNFLMYGWGEEGTQERFVEVTIM